MDAFLATRLRALAEFRRTFEAPRFSFGGWVEPPPRNDGTVVMARYRFAPEAEAFIDTLHRDSWILPDFDWRSWADSEEGRALSEDPAALMQASPEQLAHLFTALVRAERFGEGTLDGAFESGLLPLAVRRAAILLREVEAG